MRHPGEARSGLVGTWLGAVLALILGAACSDNAVVAKRDAGPVCSPSGATELACSDSVDDDCDGQTDCLDPDCAGVACGGVDGFQCMAGGCARPGDLPPLPPILQSTVQHWPSTPLFRPRSHCSPSLSSTMPSPQK